MGAAARAAPAREIRTWLRNRGYEVIEIAANVLDDEDAMVRHFRQPAGYLGMPEIRSRVRDDRVVAELVEVIGPEPPA